MPPDPQPDLTAILEELRQTRLAYQMASEMSQFKGGFLARIAHELRSPLNSLIGVHQLILADLCDNPAEEREFIAQAHTAALKLMKIIDEIVFVSKVAHGTNQMEIKPVRLSEILQSVYDLTHLPAAHRSLHLQLSLPSSEAYILADFSRLQQVLVNLVNTAISRVSEGNIKISANTSSIEGYACIWIEAQFSNEVWTEPVDLLHSANDQNSFLDKSNKFSPLEKLTLSPELNLLIDQNLIELMQGKLKVLAGESDPNLTQIECSIPLFKP